MERDQQLFMLSLPINMSGWFIFMGGWM